jgi:hypothetical protein
MPASLSATLQASGRAACISASVRSDILRADRHAPTSVAKWWRLETEHRICFPAGSESRCP